MALPNRGRIDAHDSGRRLRQVPRPANRRWTLGRGGLSSSNVQPSSTAVHVCSGPLIDYFRHNVYVTPGGIASQRYLRWAIEVLGVGRVMHATDYPFNGPHDFAAKESSIRPHSTTGSARRSALRPGNVSARASSVDSTPNQPYGGATFLVGTSPLLNTAAITRSGRSIGAGRGQRRGGTNHVQFDPLTRRRVCGTARVEP